jgi:parallel beta-helix repeat protein
VATLALALLAGCKLESQKQVTLQLSAAGTCVRTSLACGGELGVFVADSMTNEVLETRCVSFAADAGMALDKLPVVLQDLMPPLRDLPQGRSLVVEVAAWSPASGKGCPRFDPNLSNAGGSAAVPSYFGRSAATMAGAATSITVSLQCLPSSCISCTKTVSPKGSEPIDAGGAEVLRFAATDGEVTDAKSDAGAPPDAKADVAPTDAKASDAKPDAAAAEVAPPLGPVAKMVASLGNGQTGCLEDGTYNEDITFSKGGSSANPITLAAKPGAHPILKGILTIPDTTDNIAIVGLTLEGPAQSKSATPLIRGDRVALRGNDISNHGVDCVALGDPKYGPAKTVTIEGNRIHGCKAGVVAAFAESSTIAHNTIFDNTGDGVSLFPNGDSITIEHNIIDGNGNGVLFGSDGSVVSINDNARLNVISNSTGFNVYSAFPMAVGTGNNATMNCLWMGAKGDVATPMKGFTAKDNVTADPMYVDRAAKDFRLAPTSMCAGMGPLR